MSIVLNSRSKSIFVDFESLFYQILCACGLGLVEKLVIFAIFWKYCTTLKATSNQNLVDFRKKICKHFQGAQDRIFSGCFPSNKFLSWHIFKLLPQRIMISWFNLGRTRWHLCVSMRSNWWIIFAFLGVPMLFIMFIIHDEVYLPYTVDNVLQATDCTNGDIVNFSDRFAAEPG